MNFIVASIIGALVGSFLNMLTYRLPLGLPLVFSRSQCTSCKRPLSTKSLVPLFSYIFQRGRCAMCNTPISPRYFFVELCTSISVVLLVHGYGFSSEALFWGLVISCCLAHFVIDFEHLILPHSISLTLFILSIGHSIYTNSFITNGPSLLVGMGILLAIRIIGSLIYKKEALGLGDVFFMGAIGLFLPLNQLFLMLYIAFVTGGAFGLGILATGKKDRTDALPFGPFLIFGFLSTLFFGDMILRVIWQ